MSVTAWKNVPYLRGIAIVFVIIIHSMKLSGGFLLRSITSYSFSAFPVHYAFITFVYNLLGVCIPMFLFASAFTVYRMYKSRKTTEKMGSNLLIKYICWCIPLSLFFYLKNLPDSTIGDTVLSFFIGGPMPGYWFLVLLIEIYFLTPVWILLVRRSTGLAIILALIMQALNYGRQFPDYEIPVLIERLIIFPIIYSPPFIFGLVFSKHVKELTKKLPQCKIIILLFTMLSAAAVLCESYLIGRRNDWLVVSFNDWIVTNYSIFFFLFSASLIIAFMTVESRRTMFRKKVIELGNESLGIILTLDVSLFAMTFLIWHVPEWFLGFSLDTFIANALPEQLSRLSLFVFPLYLLTGFLLPHNLIALIKKIFGPFSQYLC